MQNELLLNEGLHEARHIGSAAKSCCQNNQRLKWLKGPKLCKMYLFSLPKNCLEAKNEKTRFDFDSCSSFCVTRHRIQETVSYDVGW